MLGVALGIACTTYSGHSAASPIVAPVSAFATSNFGPTRNDYSIKNTINQSGLSLKYVSGVTDFDSYLASKPQHTSNANGNEWFSQDFGKASQKPNAGKVAKSSSSSGNQKAGNFGSTNGKRSAGKAGKVSTVPKSGTSNANSSPSAISSTPLVSIIYGFSEAVSINGFVLWNEEFAGIGKTELLSSIDGITYTLLSTITPKPSKFAPAGKVIPYLAQVFSFDPTIMRFFQLLIYDCPGPPAKESSYRGCGFGEVAFSSAPPRPSDSPVVPVPAAFPLLASGLGLFAWFGRRRTRA